MRSAPCAWAPSHTLHAMPPRITRNSHRPRASDRTMVDLEHQFGLPLFRTRWHRHHPRRKLMSMGNRPSFSREAQFQWAGSRETNLASGRGRTFFLTSLFIELIDPVRRGFECNGDLSPIIHSRWQLGAPRVSLDSEQYIHLALKVRQQLLPQH